MDLLRAQPTALWAATAHQPPPTPPCPPPPLGVSPLTVPTAAEPVSSVLRPSKAKPKPGLQLLALFLTWMRPLHIVPSCAYTSQKYTTRLPNAMTLLSFALPPLPDSGSALVCRARLETASMYSVRSER